MDEFDFKEEVSEFNDLLKQQAIMNAEFQSQRRITELPFNCNVKKFIVPAFAGRTKKFLSIDGDACLDKQLIFSALYTAHYLYFYSDDFCESRKDVFLHVMPTFVKFLNDHQLAKADRVLFLKDYEAYRVKKDQVKTQSTGLGFVLLCLNDALSHPKFHEQLNVSQRGFLLNLTDTAVAPKDEVTQVTLTQWFGRQTWLRRADIGIGHNLYARLASPKALMSSFRITTETALFEIQAAKSALISLILDEKWTVEDLPFPHKSPQEFRTRSAYGDYLRKHYLKLMVLIGRAYYKACKRTTNNKNLTNAMNLIVAGNSTQYAQDVVLEGLLSNSKIPDRHVSTGGRRHRTMSIKQSSALFSFSFLQELVCYVSCPNSQSKSVPACIAEHLLFQWLMAFQTVQPSDIPKLIAKDFQFVRRQNGQITHVGLRYFKSRANTEHSVKTLEARSTMGSAIIKFVLEQAAGSSDKPLAPSLKLTGQNWSEENSISQVLYFCHKFLREDINKKLISEGSSSVFLDASVALIKNGKSESYVKYKKSKDCIGDVEEPVNSTCFSLTAIKNSSIHARSDSFTPTQIINYHSHSNQTERESYLSPQNEQWLNNCGLITRAVMQDLTVNLFRASKSDKQIFNSEFTRSATLITSQREDMLSRMKILSGKQDGSVDDLGFTDFGKRSDDQSDIILLVDSPETVMRHRHYLSEIQKKHKLLIKNAPEFTLFTVLPTTEWIESLFDTKQFSVQSIRKGDELFKQFKEILPPLFTAHIGG